MGRAILASAAISGLVLPISLDGRIATDGGWVRNFPFEHAYRNPEVARNRSVPLHPELPGQRPRIPRAHARAARAIPCGPSRPRSPLRIAPRSGTRLPRRAGALRRADRAAHARGVRTQRGRRGSARRRARDVRARATAPAGGRDRNRDSPPRHHGVAGGSAQISSHGLQPRASRSATTATCRHSSCAGRRARRASTRRSAAKSHGRPSASGRSSSAATPSPTRHSRRIPHRNSKAIWPLRPQSGRLQGCCAMTIPTQGWSSAPKKKVGRGPGRRSDPEPRKVSRPRSTGAVLPASPGGMRAAVRA